MPKSLLSAFENKPLLDIRSLGRQGPGRRDRVTHSELQIMRRTLNRDPEVMVKVISKGAQDLKAIEKHLKYIGREGDIDMIDDQGQAIRAPEAAKGIIEDWDLDIDSQRRAFRLGASGKGKAPKLVHKLMFSMPPGTSPEKVLAAVENFAREEFALQHRYVMALHTDEPHPHVHMLVKAMSEQGVRLNIRKATLRMWRSEFARHLREQGVRANATERLVRRRPGRTIPDGLRRASERGAARDAPKKYVPTASSVRALDNIRLAWQVITNSIVSRENPLSPAPPPPE